MKEKDLWIFVVFGLILLAWLICSLWILWQTPHPPIDVWWFTQGAAQALLNGKNPYLETFNVPLPDTSVYSNVTHYVYPPFSLLLSSPFFFFFKDVRYANLLAVLGASLFLFGVSKKSGKSNLEAILLSSLFLFHPLWHLVLQWNWTESTFIFLIYGSVFFFLSGNERAGAIMGGLFLSAKQYLLPMILVFPSFIKKKRSLWFYLFLFLLILPLIFIVRAPGGFWQQVVKFHLDVAPRADSLSLSAYVLQNFGKSLPGWLPFVFISGIMCAGIRLKKNYRVILNAALAYFFFFWLNKTAFLNYYFFIGSLIILALALIPKEVVSPSRDGVIDTESEENFASRLIQNARIQAKYVLVFSLTLFPILRIIYILATNGVNNLSVDDVMIAPLVDKILSGSYEWRNIFHDTFINGHAQILPILTHALFAKIFHWNVHAILYFGIAVTVFKLFLLYDLFTSQQKTSLRWALLPVLSFLLFSPSQISVFEFEFPCIQLGYNHLGFLLGLWGLVRFPNRWKGVFLMILGGLLAIWSWASGILVWPVFLLTMILLKYKKPAYYINWASGALFSCILYFYFLVLKPVKDLYPLVEQRPSNSHLLVSLFNYDFIVRAFGWPFSEDFSLEVALFRGMVGLILLCVGSGILLGLRHKLNWKRLVPSLMVLTFGILNIWEISLFRVNLAQWYATPFMYFWIGLVGLSYALFSQSIENFDQVGVSQRNFFSLTLLWSGSIIAILTYYYFTSNLSFADKSFYLETRSPSSASCLKNYDTAPTYCEQPLFLWLPGQLQLLSRLAAPLAKNHLSVFSPNQLWTLQGDFILDNVRIHGNPDTPDVHWSADLTQNKVPYSDYRHLNLFLHSPNYVDWTVTLPKELRHADFHSAVAISEAAPTDPSADGVIFEISAEVQGKPRQLLYAHYVASQQREWIPLSLSLDQYAGQTVTLRLSSQINKSNMHDWAMYRYPYIDLTLDSEKTATPAFYQPSNTDLSSSFVKTTGRDFIFDLLDKGAWKVENKIFNQGSQADEKIQTSREYKEPINLCLAEFSHLYLKMALSSQIYPRAAMIFLKFNGEPNYEKGIALPFLKDEDLHAYTYDLKLLEKESKVRLTGIKIDLPKEKDSGKSGIYFSDLRFVRGNNKGTCD